MLFAGASLQVGGCLASAILIFQGKFREVFCRGVFLKMLAATFFIVISSQSIFFFAGQRILASQSAILFQGNILFTFLFFGLLGFERITVKKILGAALICCGAALILLENFSAQFSLWGFVFLLGTVILPFGNFFQKAAMRRVSPPAMLAFRSFVGGACMLAFSFFFEDFANQAPNWKDGWPLVVANGIVAFGIGRILFLGALARIDASKVMAISGAMPAFSLVWAFWFLGEIPTLSQLLGFAAIFLGVLHIVHQKALCELQGKVVRGKGLGRKLGFPTLNFQGANLPQELSGVFAGWVQIAAEKIPAAIFLGQTKLKSERSLEAHLLPFPGKMVGQDLTGTQCTICLQMKIRKVRHFPNLENLQKQIAKDCEKIRLLQK